MIIFSGVKIAFADQDIGYMISNWLDRKRIESLKEIDNTISEEQATQTSRLKSEINKKIKAAEEQYHSFIESEKLKRVQGLEKYTTQLIEKYEAPEISREETIKKLECIKQKAEIEMDIVLGKKGENELISCSNN